MPRRIMRKKIVQYTLCMAVLAGLSACNQQGQEAVVQPVTPEVKPVAGSDKPSAPVKQTKPGKTTKPANRPKPVQTEPQVVPVESTPGQAEIGNAPVQSEMVKPVSQKPLGKRVSHVDMKGKYVALTFDDGPHPSLTPKALDILNRHGAKGTFFMLGQNATRYKSIVARAAAEGHELGVHTWSHIKMNSASRAKVDNEISRTQKTLAEVSGITPRVMRPPYGATNKALIDHMYNRYGMASVMWDVDTLDWRKPGVEKVINTAVNNARPGSIILVHDIHATTLAALEGIVTGLQARGFQLVTVSELMLLGKQEAAAKEAEETAAAAQTTDMPVQGEPSATVETPAAQPETPADPQQDMHAASDEEAVIQLDETNEI